MPFFERRGRAGLALACCALLWLMLHVDPAFAQDQESAEVHRLDGHLRLDHYGRAKDFSQRTGLTGATAELKLDSAPTAAWRTKLHWRGHQEDLGHGLSKARGQMVEAFGLWQSDRVDVKLGRQIVAWGRADGINPTDNLSPRDYRIALPYEEDQRSGTGAIRVNYYPDGEQTWTFYAAPDFAPSQIPLPTANVTFREHSPVTDGRWPMAVKLDKRGDNLDWSLSYFRGFNPIPELRETAQADIVDLRYPKIQVYGADMACNVGRFGLRAELARLVRGEPQPGAGQSGHWAWVVGVDRDFQGDLNVGVQVLARRNVGQLPNEDMLRAHPWEQLNAVTFHQSRRDNFGATLRIGKKWLNGTLEGELLWVSYFNPSTSYWRPLVAYAVTDKVRLTVMAELYQGPAESFFGRNRPIQTGALELRYAF